MFLRSSSLRLPIVIAGIILTLPVTTSAKTHSRWEKAPKPKFPKEALKAFAEGSVTIRAVIARDGAVARATVSKSSGDARLDNAAVQAVLKWKMKPESITPSYLKQGFPIVFDFTQEAMPGAVYSDRTAYFESTDSNVWIFAPFPAYPEMARRAHQQGTVMLVVTIGANSMVSRVEVAQSSGSPMLDTAAITAVRHWRAHKRFAGTQYRLPIKFSLRAFR